MKFLVHTYLGTHPFCQRHSALSVLLPTCGSFSLILAIESYSLII